MIPLYDENPRSALPILTLTFIAINVVVFLLQNVAGLSQYRFSLIPSLVTGTGPGIVAEGPRQYQLSQAGLTPAWLTVFTSMFMHGGFLHLGGNMLFLWVFGDNLEDRLGWLKYFLFYVLCGIAAAVAHIAFQPSSQIPTVGASGAIAGVMGGYIVLFPNARIKTLVPLGFFTTLASVPAYLVLGFWFLYQLLLGAIERGGAQGGGVAYMAHVGGFVAGVVLIKLFRPARWSATMPDPSGSDRPWS